MNAKIIFKKYKTSPFSLESNENYEEWRDSKLKNYPENIGDLIVEINDPRSVTYAEHKALLNICRKTNMVIYASKTGTNPDPQIPLSMGYKFGVEDLDHNWLSDKSGLTSLTVAKEGIRQRFIPYTNNEIHWHTDGYYNTKQKQINALLLHVVQRAAQGGENSLMDHEMAYILLREENPEYIQALMGEKVMTIPARIDEGKIARAEESGPVFSINGNGDLHMRYTIRANNVIWSEDPITQEALKYLNFILNSDSPYIFKGLLEPGMGLVSNNVLHNRTHFIDDEIHQRHFYRARYYSRLKDTSILDNNSELN